MDAYTPLCSPAERKQDDFTGNEDNPNRDSPTRWYGSGRMPGKVSQINENL